MSDRFKKLATECAELLGFQTPQVENDFYALLIDDIRVLIEPTNVGEEHESFFFCSHIGALEEHCRQQVTDYMLAKNGDTRFSGAASIGVLPETDTLVVFQLLPPQVNRAELMINELNKFVEIAERVAKELARLSQLSNNHSESIEKHMLSV